MEKNIFNEYLKNIDICLTAKQQDQLHKYYEMLVEWNEKINLTSIIEEEQVYIKHFYDSMTINKVIDLRKVQTLCDIGTGAGFPGIVIKIVFPNIKVTLVDSLTKRINFLNLVKETLNLENIEIINSRAEEYATSHNEQFDVVTCRAVAKLNILLELTIPLIKIGGNFIPLKGSKAQEEIKEAKTAIEKLDIELEEVSNITLPKICEPRTIIKFKKLKSTPKKYPREFKQIVKNPL